MYINIRIDRDDITTDVNEAGKRCKRHPKYREINKKFIYI